MKVKLLYTGGHQPQGEYEVEESLMPELIKTGLWKHPLIEKIKKKPEVKDDI